MSEDLDRLTRIEGKLDKLQDAVVTLARIEERTNAIFINHNKLSERVRVLEDGTTRMEKKIDNRFGERLFWLVLTTVVAGVVAYFR